MTESTSLTLQCPAPNLDMPTRAERPAWRRAPDLREVAEGRRLIARGHAGPSVREMQSFLNWSLDLRPALATDGRVGKKTETAIRAFQEKNGLEVDGIIGDETFAAMSAELARDILIHPAYDDINPGQQEEMGRASLDTTTPYDRWNRLAPEV
jgi:peptidoglycan hydrolase-like protein with peptidoglycan-binding domain